MARLVAWLGGALFVAALLYTVYFYGVVLSDAASSSAIALPNAAAVNVLLFGIFAAHHSLFARGPTKRWVERTVPAQMERSFYVWVASLLLIGVWLSWRLTAGLLYEVDGLLRWPLHVLQLAGAYLILRAAGFLDALELAGIRQLQHQARPVVFRTNGPFGLVRHPIYLGWILMTFAAPTMTINRLIFAVVTSAYLVLAIPWEERALVAAFGDRYRSYQAIVKWRLIPGLW
jgi:protein-S-isoprenylcysteine O-methyltransferase Ste14